MLIYFALTFALSWGSWLLLTGGTPFIRRANFKKWRDNGIAETLQARPIACC